VQFRILGGVGVDGDDGVATRVPAGKQRALLMLLVLSPNRVTSSSVLSEGLWGDSQPEGPRAAVQVLVSRLRVVLGPYGNRVVSEGGGYRLDVGPSETDLALAEMLLRDGRAALGRDEPAKAAADFERALALWTSNGFEDDLRELTFALDAERRLHELRYSLIESRNDAYLLDGRHLEVLADIDGFVAAEPLREHLRAQQVVALYRSGRQAEALRAGDALRESLRDELGVEPSPEMATLARRVLDHDPALLATHAGFTTPLPAWTAESLPFVGRESEFRRLTSDLAEAIVDGVRVVVVEGEPGIGKSRFLLQIARRVAQDAIVLPVHAHDAFNPALHAVARVIAEATRRLSDQELLEVVTGFPDIPNDVERVRAAATAVESGAPMTHFASDDDLLQGVAPWIAALSAKAPVVVIIDDLDTAGTSLLHVIWQLATLAMPKRVLIVGSARESFDVTSLTPLARTIAALDHFGMSDRIVLEPLEPASIEMLLERMRVFRSPDIARRLHELTAGNPFLLAETLSISSPEQAVEQWPSPPRVRDVVRQRTAELGRATADLCNLACLFLDDFSVSILAETSGASEATVAMLIDNAVAAHVLQPASLNSFRFTHQLFRHALVTDLSDAQRAEGHRRIAGALENVGAPPALLAAHWSAASGPDVGVKVTQYARAAGQQSLRLFEPRAAIQWFQLALQHLDDERARGALLVDLAEGQQLAGDADGNATLHQAVDIAMKTKDAELTLRIVRSTTPGWSALPGASGAATKAFLDSALDVAVDDATRSRILARQAIDMCLTEPDAAERLSDRAIELARTSHDRGALSETLLRRSAISLSPHSLDARKRVLAELIDLNRHSTDVATRYHTYSGLVVTAIQGGHLTEVEHHAAEADAIAGQYDLAAIRWTAMARQAWRAGLLGDDEQAEQLIEGARAFGTESAIPGAPATAFMQLGLLRWQQHRIAEMLPFVRAAYDTTHEVFPSIALTLARALADDEAGRDEARMLLTTFAGDDLAQLRRGTFWSTTLILTAETACILELPDLARAIRDLLSPFADQVACNGIWAPAPIAYGIGVAMLGCHDPRAEQLLEQAADIAERMQSPPLAARARSGHFGQRLETGTRVP
jgi:DNA-binding SARP family transcriptional activator